MRTVTYLSLDHPIYSILFTFILFLLSRRMHETKGPRWNRASFAPFPLPLKIVAAFLPLRVHSIVYNADRTSGCETARRRDHINDQCNDVIHSILIFFFFLQHFFHTEEFCLKFISRYIIFIFIFVRRLFFFFLSKICEFVSTEDSILVGVTLVGEKRAAINRSLSWCAD